MSNQIRRMSACALAVTLALGASLAVAAESGQDVGAEMQKLP